MTPIAREPVSVSAYRYRIAQQKWTLQPAFHGSGAPPAKLWFSTDEIAATVHPDDREIVFTHFWARLELEEPYASAYRVLDAGGTARLILNTGHPYYRDGQLKGLHGLLIDLGDAAGFEHPLLLTEDRFTTAAARVLMASLGLDEEDSTMVLQAMSVQAGMSGDDLARWFTRTLARRTGDEVARENFVRDFLSCLGLPWTELDERRTYRRLPSSGHDV
ncbi:MAG: PAS domain-containing protein [Pedococcus sp.]